MEHEMHLDAIYFDEVKKGLKKVETRLLDEKRGKISVGDTIEFSKRPDDVEKIKVDVKDVKVYSSWKDLIEDTPLDFFGFNRSSREELIEGGSGYPVDKESIHKNVAFHIELKH